MCIRDRIPSLKNSKLISNNIEISEDYFNQIYVSRDLIDRKKQISFKRYKTNYYLGEDLKDYYTKTPSNISNRLQKWVLNNNTSTPTEFLNKLYIYNLFKNSVGVEVLLFKTHF